MSRKRFKFNDLMSLNAARTRQTLPGIDPGLPGGTAWACR
jgi:hypothetical protein